jgi:hypothetical protein
MTTAEAGDGRDGITSSTASTDATVPRSQHEEVWAVGLVEEAHAEGARHGGKPSGCGPRRPQADDVISGGTVKGHPPAWRRNTHDLACRTEQNRTEQNRTEQNRTEQNRTGWKKTA